MSIVAIKNAISSTIQSGDEHNDTKPLLPRDYLNSSYGSNLERYYCLDNEESSIDTSSTLIETPDKRSFLLQFDPRVISDMIIGLSDGLTVPFALTAGLSSLGDTKLVITGGLAELVSGAISMGLGGYLAAKSELQYYRNEVNKQKKAFLQNSNKEPKFEIGQILRKIGLHSQETIDLFINDLSKEPTRMLDFLIKYGEKELIEPNDNRQLTSALTIGISYFLGGFIPLIPYFFVETVRMGLTISCFAMAIALFLFGYFKTVISMGNDISQWQKIFEGLQMLIVGGFASLSAWFLVKLIGE